MRDIPLEPIPNQSLSVTIGDNRWDITVKWCGSVMAVDLTLNDLPILQGQRVVAGSDVIPYMHLQVAGNFFFITENDDLPYWGAFGDTQRMVYLTPEELANGIQP